MPELICKRLVDLIEHNADRLTRAWLADVKRRPETRSYHAYPDDLLYERVHEVYRNLGMWVCRETTAADVARVYTALGRQRHAEGFALSEVLEALILSRRHLWLLVLSEAFPGHRPRPAAGPRPQRPGGALLRPVDVLHCSRFRGGPGRGGSQAHRRPRPGTRPAPPSGETPQGGQPRRSSRARRRPA